MATIVSAPGPIFLATNPAATDLSAVTYINLSTVVEIQGASVDRSVIVLNGNSLQGATANVLRPIQEIVSLLEAVGVKFV